MQSWGSPMAGNQHLMLLLPKNAWDELSKTEKAALTYYAEDSTAKQGSYDAGEWTVVVSYSSIQPYGVDMTVVAGDGVDRSDTSAQDADSFRAAMLKK